VEDVWATQLGYQRYMASVLVLQEAGEEFGTFSFPGCEHSWLEPGGPRNPASHREKEMENSPMGYGNSSSGTENL